MLICRARACPLVPTLRSHGRKELFVVWPPGVFQHVALSSGFRFGSGYSGHIGDWLSCCRAVISVGSPEPWQPELLKEGDEALKYAVDPVHQPEIDADGLQRSEGEQTNPKRHEPV